MSPRFALVAFVLLGFAASFTVACWPVWGSPDDVYVGWPWHFYVTQDDVAYPYWSATSFVLNVAIFVGGWFTAFAVGSLMLSFFDDIPRQRRRQFDLIAAARNATLEWALSERVPLEHIEYVVPFVKTDFSLWAVFFYTTRAQVAGGQSDGNSGRVIVHFKQALTDVGYPTQWLALVSTKFASKEEVDERCEGRYYYYVK